jgi:hypothetical protein
MTTNYSSSFDRRNSNVLQLTPDGVNWSIVRTHSLRTDMDQPTDQEPETDGRPLATSERARIARWLLRIAYADEWAPPGTFLRSHTAILDRQIQRADADIKGRKARHQRVVTRRDDEHDDE